MSYRGHRRKTPTNTVVATADSNNSGFIEFRNTVLLNDDDDDNGSDAKTCDGDSNIDLFSY